MTTTNILAQLASKGANINDIVEQLLRDGEQIAKVVKALRTEKSSKKYSYEKVLRLVSESKPELVYPFFEDFSRRLNDDNSFLKWGAIMTVANLTAADTHKKFESIFDRYYDPITGPVMVTAANIIGSSARIAAAKPELIPSITREILKVEKANYQIRGEPSPECRNVAIGAAIDSFDTFYGQIRDKTKVHQFIKRQINNPRKQVAQKAKRFVDKHGI